jgi:hypothetical protein
MIIDDSFKKWIIGTLNRIIKYNKLFDKKLIVHWIIYLFIFQKGGQLG